MPMHHASFTITRDFKAKPARVFAANTEFEAKSRWFLGSEGFETLEYSLDARPFGRETWRGRYQGGPVIANNCIYFDVLKDERLIFAYEMFLGDDRLSASLVTMEFSPHNGGTRLSFTEQGAYCDEPQAIGRKEGTLGLIDRLEEEVES